MRLDSSYEEENWGKRKKSACLSVQEREKVAWGMMHWSQLPHVALHHVSE